MDILINTESLLLQFINDDDVKGHIDIYNMRDILKKDRTTDNKTNDNFVRYCLYKNYRIEFSFDYGGFIKSVSYFSTDMYQPFREDGLPYRIDYDLKVEQWSNKYYKRENDDYPISIKRYKDTIYLNFKPKNHMYMRDIVINRSNKKISNIVFYEEKEFKYQLINMTSKYPELQSIFDITIENEESFSINDQLKELLSLINIIML